MSSFLFVFTQVSYTWCPGPNISFSPIHPLLPFSIETLIPCPFRAPVRLLFHVPSHLIPCHVPCITLDVTSILPAPPLPTDPQGVVRSLINLARRLLWTPSSARWDATPFLQPHHAVATQIPSYLLTHSPPKLLRSSGTERGVLASETSLN